MLNGKIKIERNQYDTTILVLDGEAEIILPNTVSEEQALSIAYLVLAMLEKNTNKNLIDVKKIA